MPNTQNNGAGIRTPYGVINALMIDEFLEIAGWRIEQGELILLSDEVIYWHLNTSPERKMNEGRHYKKKGWLTIRDLNFQYAYYKCDCNVEQALTYAKKMLFGMDNKPLYLSDEMSMKAGLNIDKYNPGYSYSKIIDNEKDAYNHRLTNKQKKDDDAN